MLSLYLHFLFFVLPVADQFNLPSYGTLLLHLQLYSLVALHCNSPALLPFTTALLPFTTALLFCSAALHHSSSALLCCPSPQLFRSAALHRSSSSTPLLPPAALLPPSSAMELSLPTTALVPLSLSLFLLLCKLPLVRCSTQCSCSFSYLLHAAFSLQLPPARCFTTAAPARCFHSAHAASCTLLYCSCLLHAALL
jgi:hypothetical protein